MKVKVIRDFRDKTTAENIDEQELRKVGDVIECDDKLAEERIKGGFVEKLAPSKPKKDE